MKSKSTNPFDYPYESDVDHNNMVCHGELVGVYLLFNISSIVLLFNICLFKISS